MTQSRMRNIGNYITITIFLISAGMTKLASQGISLDSISKDSIVIDKGSQLFDKFCFQCHELGKEKIGPDLTSVYNFYSFSWLYAFITNSDSLIAKGDTLALDIYNYYKEMPMPDHDLTKNEVKSILAYIKSKSPDPEPKNLGNQPKHVVKKTPSIEKKGIYFILGIIFIALLLGIVKKYWK